MLDKAFRAVRVTCDELPVILSRLVLDLVAPLAVDVVRNPRTGEVCGWRDPDMAQVRLKLPLKEDVALVAKPADQNPRIIKAIVFTVRAARAESRLNRGFERSQQLQKIRLCHAVRDASDN